MKDVKKWQIISFVLSALLLMGSLYGTNRLGDSGQILYLATVLLFLAMLIIAAKKEKAFGTENIRIRLFFGIGVATAAAIAAVLSNWLVPDLNKWVVPLIVGLGAGLA
jgi:multisubunit Na+/H+ antiporter MnhB subunit